MIIVEKENFLPKSECVNLIDFYKKNENESFSFRDTFPLDVILDSIGDSILRECKKYDENIILDTCQIVKWPSGSFMEPHLDRDFNVFAALVYLNDDYVGGETCFEHTQIHPKTGKLIFFSGNKIPHAVNMVENKTRYTLALWFKKNESC